MSFLEFDTSAIPDALTVPDGETQLVFEHYELKPRNNQPVSDQNVYVAACFRPMATGPDGSPYDSVWANLLFPTPDDTVKENVKLMWQREIKAFLKAFGAPNTQWSLATLEAIKGNTGWAMVRKNSDGRPEVKKWIVGA